MNHKQNAERYFTEELASIQNKEIKKFVLNVFDKFTPDYFWTVPCSTSGKYHPQVSLGVGGLIRHTKLAVWWGIELLHALGSSPELKDITTLQNEVIATLLLHDMIKNGKGLNAQGYPLDRGVTGTHGVALATMIFDDGYDTTLPAWKERIFIGIACHMGVWTTNPEYKPDYIMNRVHRAFAQLIHLADYCASRKVDAKMLKLNELQIGDSDGS